MQEESVNVIIDAKFVEGSSFKGPKPLTIFFEDDSISMSNVTMHQSRLIVEVPSFFPTQITRCYHGIIIIIMCLRQLWQISRALEA